MKWAAILIFLWGGCSNDVRFVGKPIQHYVSDVVENLPEEPAPSRSPLPSPGPEENSNGPNPIPLPTSEPTPGEGGEEEEEVINPRPSPSSPDEEVRRLKERIAELERYAEKLLYDYNCLLEDLAYYERMCH